ncbi:dual specificity protein phosphatase family protein [Chamaesiphon sp. VAR_48_metabat_135_sub]|uniref:protein-tyrosine phosphatase family protein n=1 Tax=Chamaesiphon sp. VAR_48_metabat_135_sub TaxID=2964699 RepID=UPI00286ADC88|nr:dual specificity protein phosphatase family protein [Chamaesiphon sp. VAR_48_metabat_135_sub]
MYKFAAASDNELIVFGSTRPGYSHDRVCEWIEFMRGRDIQHVCCLLSEKQLNRYADLLGNYQQAFGIERVCWAPIEDFSLATPEMLVDRILPFLAIADRQNQKVVVHCSGGIGRTGHILAAWLVAGRGFSSKAAIAAVQKTGRNPYEAIIAAPFKSRNPWQVAAELQTLLSSSLEA